MGADEGFRGFLISDSVGTLFGGLFGFFGVFGFFDFPPAVVVVLEIVYNFFFLLRLLSLPAALTPPMGVFFLPLRPTLGDLPHDHDPLLLFSKLGFLLGFLLMFFIRFLTFISKSSLVYTFEMLILGAGVTAALVGSFIKGAISGVK